MTDTAITKVAAPMMKASRLAQVTGFTDQVIALIRQTVAPGATPLELATYLYAAHHTGFNPLARPPQIFFIKYSKNDPATIVVAVDGYRAKAEDSGVYAGSDPAEFEFEDEGQPKGAPSKATVTVWKMVQGQRVPFTASVRWMEFYADKDPSGMRKKMPSHMLGKVAETHALRKGFPGQTAGLATPEPPRQWVEAAQLDEAAALDPDAVAYNSRRFDEIFNEGAEQQRIDQETARAKRSRPKPLQAPPPGEPQAEARVVDEDAEGWEAIEQDRQEQTTDHD